MKHFQNLILLLLLACTTQSCDHPSFGSTTAQPVPIIATSKLLPAATATIIAPTPKVISATTLITTSPVRRTVDKVSVEEWESLRDELRTSYNNLLNLIKSAPEWTGEDEIASMVAVVAHTAYHLGEIRQALCSLRP